MTKKTLTERVAELEREVEGLKAQPRAETHIHYHYPYQQPYIAPQQPWKWSSWSPNTAADPGILNAPTSLKP